jgi:glutamyl-tRNA synthetase
MIRLRFAPSPTGRLHVGNARVALINWLFARSEGGRFLLRLDDTDRARSTAEFAAGIDEDLTWLGLAWDEFARQSERMGRYAAAAETLKRSGRLYPAFETKEELDLKRKNRLSRGLPPIYDRAALALSADQRAALEAKGEAPHWRFRMAEGTVAWRDLIHGELSFEGAAIGDPVLIRADGQPLYTLSSVVDDVDLEVSHVIRGDDHISNTAVQIQIIEALGGRVPEFGHVPLLVDAAGGGLSKRLGALSLADLREQGIEAIGLASYLAKLGTADPIEPRPDLATLVEEFDIARFNQATARFDGNELAHVSARVVHACEFDEVRGRLSQLGIEGADRRFWEIVRPNLARISDARDWWRIVHGAIEPVIEDPSFIAEALELMPSGAFTQDTFGQWTGALALATGRKGKALYRPLRLALTGLDHGPDLKHLLPLIGRERALTRLAGRGDS